MFVYLKRHLMDYLVLIYDKNCVGSKSYFKLAEEFMKNNQVESAA